MRTPAELRRIKDPLSRAAAANKVIEDYRRATAELADLRAAAIAEALGADAPRGARIALARALGITPQGLTKLLKRAAR